MAKSYYHISTPGLWQSSSGNGILAIVNAAGSNKKINIHSIEITNNTRLGYTSTASTQAPPPAKFKIGPVTALAGGDSLSPIACDSQVSWPSTVQCKTNTAYTPTYVDLGSVLSYTATAASVGPYRSIVS